MPRINPKAKPFLDKIKQWKKDNPGWEGQDAWLRVMKRLRTDATRYLYKVNIPWFFTYVDMTPDQVIELRIKQLESEDVDENEFFEDKAIEFKRFMVNFDYGAKTVETRLSVLSGFFSNYRKMYRLDAPNLFKLSESSERKASNRQKNPPDNCEIRAIYEVANRKHRIAYLMGYQCGLAPTDVVKITWANLNIDFDTEQRDFIPIDHTRNKTDEEGTIVLNPDLLHELKNEWVDQGKPDTGHILNFRGNKLQTRHPNEWLKESAIKALGEKRGRQVMFKDLRDSFNDVIKSHDEIKQEIADRLMGHSPKGSRGEYYVSPTTIVESYRQVFPKLAVNGWNRKKQVVELDELTEKLDGLVSALNQVENENAAYKTRIDNLQGQVVKIGEAQQEQSDWMREIMENAEVVHRDILDNYEGVIDAVAPLGDRYAIFADPDSEKGLTLRILKKPPKPES